MTDSNDVPARQEPSDGGSQSIDPDLINAAVQVTRRSLEAYQGPLPHPKMLREFDEIVPGSAERIIALMERQADHRMYLEKCVVEGDNRRANWGVIAATAIILVGFGVSTVLIFWGHTIPGTLISVFDLAAITGVFIYGTNSRRKEREQKAVKTKSK